jgi:Protein of unknown function (DUF2924)
MPAERQGRHLAVGEVAREQRAADLLDEIAAADHETLQQQWKAVFGCAAPLRSRADLLRRALAYEAQAKLFGGADRVRRRLARLARGETETGARGPIRLREGTRLIREWQGEVHQVTVRDCTVEYRGERYRSLSEVARLITGTRWSGPLFFGLKKPGGSQ